MTKNREILSERKAPLLLEVDGGVRQIDKIRKDPDHPIDLWGLVSSGDKINRNRRRYGWEYLKKECVRFMEEEIKTNRAYGELDHPEESMVPELKNACWAFEDMWFKGTDVYAKIKVLNAYMPPNAPGRMVRGFLLNGKSVGASSRSLGSVEERYDPNHGSFDDVLEDLEIICWDAVAGASNFGSERMVISEASFKKRKTKRITESMLKNKIECKGGVCTIVENKLHLKKSALSLLTEDEKVLLEILGVEKYLQLSTDITK